MIAGVHYKLCVPAGSVVCGLAARGILDGQMIVRPASANGRRLRPMHQAQAAGSVHTLDLLIAICNRLRPHPHTGELQIWPRTIGNTADTKNIFTRLTAAVTMKLYKMLHAIKMYFLLHVKCQIPVIL